MNEAFEALGDNGADLEADLLSLRESLDQRPHGEAIWVPGTYLETLIARA